jgi:hypothetical protein
VIAIDDQLAGNWQAPASLQKLAPAATRVTIIEGQTATLNLTTMVVR